MVSSRYFPIPRDFPFRAIPRQDSWLLFAEQPIQERIVSCRAIAIDRSESPRDRWNRSFLPDDRRKTINDIAATAFQRYLFETSIPRMWVARSRGITAFGLDDVIALHLTTNMNTSVHFLLTLLISCLWSTVDRVITKKNHSVRDAAGYRSAQRDLEEWKYGRLVNGDRRKLIISDLDFVSGSISGTGWVQQKKSFNQSIDANVNKYRTTYIATSATLMEKAKNEPSFLVKNSSVKFHTNLDTDFADPSPSSFLWFFICFTVYLDLASLSCSSTRQSLCYGRSQIKSRAFRTRVTFATVLISL